ncbi:MAG: type II toxin-antitoxin system VapC family toxin [Treponema sp.]|jgi:PIN domain nuclease of toxin-antitoxin system|nr:type II toxin-antitoxin system VapC family toxin [Treponema sp.]
MKYLLDTHAMIWFVEDSPKLPKSIYSSIINGENFVSAVSLWEVAIKMNINKFTFDGGFSPFFEIVKKSGFEILPIKPEHLKGLMKLPLIHRDPFDRLIISTAVSENILLLTNDDNIQKYDVKWAW